MVRLLRHILCRLSGVVLALLREVCLGVRHAPVPKAAGEAFLVEVEVLRVAGVSVLAAPYLYAGLGVARKYRDRLLALLCADCEICRTGDLVVVDGPRLVASRRTRPRACPAPRTCSRYTPIGLAALKQVRVHDEVLDAVLAQELLDALAVVRGKPASFDRRRPFVGRPVRAFQAARCPWASSRICACTR